MSSALDDCTSVAGLAKLLAAQMQGKVNYPLLRGMVSYDGHAPVAGILPLLASGHFAATSAYGVPTQAQGAAYDATFAGMGKPLHRHRAAAYGFVTREGLSRLQRLAASRGWLRVLTYRAGALGRYPGRLIVERGFADTSLKEEPRCEIGFSRSKSIQAARGQVPDALIKALVAASQVIVYDQEWGQRARLWQVLQQAFK